MLESGQCAPVACDGRYVAAIVDVGCAVALVSSVGCIRVGRAGSGSDFDTANDQSRSVYLVFYP